MPRSPIEMKPERGALTLPRKVQEAARQRCRSTARSTCRAMAPPTPIQRHTDGGAGASSGQLQRMASQCAVRQSMPGGCCGRSPISDDALTKITGKRRFTGYRCTGVTNGLFGSSRWIASFSRNSWSLRRIVSLTDLPFIPSTNSSWRHFNGRGAFLKSQSFARCA